MCEIFGQGARAHGRHAGQTGKFPRADDRSFAAGICRSGGQNRRCDRRADGGNGSRRQADVCGARSDRHRGQHSADRLFGYEQKTRLFFRRHPFGCKVRRRRVYAHGVRGGKTRFSYGRHRQCGGQKDVRRRDPHGFPFRRCDRLQRGSARGGRGVAG